MRMGCRAAAELAEMRNRIRLLQAETPAVPLRLPTGPPLEAIGDAFAEPPALPEYEEYQVPPQMPPRRKPR